MQGPHGNYDVQTGAKLVDDLSRARRVGEGEPRDFGRAKHTTGSFKGKTPQDQAQKIRGILGPDPKTRPVAGPPRSTMAETSSAWAPLGASLPTGHPMARSSGKQHRENDFWFQLIEDKLLHCIDWSHRSRASFNLYSADPKGFRKLSGPWKSKEPLTTSYQVLMEPPVIAHRDRNHRVLRPAEKINDGREIGYV
jgi:hypothetical protein